MFGWVFVGAMTTIERLGDVSYNIIMFTEMDSEEQCERWASEETTVEPLERLVALEEQAARVQRSVMEMEQRREEMERQRDEARGTLEKALGELQRVRGELNKVCAEVKSSHAREFGRLEETKKLKESNRRLEDEVARLDKVALGLENELSAAELALEKKEHDGNSLKALEEELAIALSDVQSKEWRIDDLVSQVGDLKECLVEYQERIVDLERKNEHLVRSLEESEASYYSAKHSSIASLQRMDARLSELRHVVSKEGSNATLEHVLVKDDGKRTSDNGVYSTTPDTPESRMVGFSEVLPVGGLSREGSTLLDMEGRLCELEREYSGAMSLCEELKKENAALKSREVEVKSDSRRTMEMALERIEEESKAKVEELLKKQKDDLEAVHVRALEQLSKENKSLEDALRDMVEKTSKREDALESAHADVKETRKENKRLMKEKDALCIVIEELKQALSVAEQRIVHPNIHGKENPAVQSTRVKSPQKGVHASPGIGRGTPLRSLAVNVLRE